MLHHTLSHLIGPGYTYGAGEAILVDANQAAGPAVEYYMSISDGMSRIVHEHPSSANTLGDWLTTVLNIHLLDVSNTLNSLLVAPNLDTRSLYMTVTSEFQPLALPVALTTTAAVTSLGVQFLTFVVAGSEIDAFLAERGGARNPGGYLH